VQLHQLRYFVAVAETQNVTRAAAEIHVAQPSVSAQIRKLEVELGAALFHRDASGMQLTRAGETLLPMARQVLADVEEATARVKDLNGLRRGRLEVGATPSLARSLLPDVLMRYRSRYPKIVIELTEAGSQDLVEALNDGVLEIALVVLPITASNLVTTPLAEEELVAIVAPDHELARRQRLRVEELRDTPLVMFGKGYELRRETLEACCIAGFNPIIASEGGDIDAVLALVSAGMGAAMVPSIAASGHRGVHVLRLSDPTPSRTIGTAVRADRIQSRASMAFSKELDGILRGAGWPAARPPGLEVVAGTTTPSRGPANARTSTEASFSGASPSDGEVRADIDTVVGRKSRSSGALPILRP
jgi:DNA-binding transcriptional LysR family regulator